MTLYYSGELIFHGQIPLNDPIFGVIDQLFTDEYEIIENKDSTCITFSCASCTHSKNDGLQEIADIFREAGHPLTYGIAEYTGTYGKTECDTILNPKSIEGKHTYNLVSDTWEEESPIHLTDTSLANLRNALNDATIHTNVLIPDTPFSDLPKITDNKIAQNCEKIDIGSIAFGILTKIYKDEKVWEDVKNLYLYANTREKAIMDTLLIQLCGKTLGEIIETHFQAYIIPK